MKHVEITVFDPFLLERLRLSNELIPFEKVEKRKFIASIDTEQDELDLSMFVYHPYLVEHWWIQEMILFVVGIFGIFCPHEAKNNVVFNYKSKIKLTEDRANLTIRRSFKDKVIEVVGAVSEDEANERINQPLIAKRRKILKWSKIGFTFGLVLIALLVVLLIAIS